METNNEKQIMSEEIWLDVPNFESLYQASNLGRVRKIKKDKEGNVKYHVMSPSKHKYLALHLHKEKQRYPYKVHQIIAMTFLGSLVKGIEVNHKDHNRHNNRLDNLEYMTPKENSRHRVEAGRHFCPIGEKNGNAKLTEDDVREIRRAGWQDNIKHHARVYGISPGAYYRILNNQSWRHVI